MERQYIYLESQTDKAIKWLIDLGFDTELNTAQDLLDAIDEVVLNNYMEDE